MNINTELMNNSLAQRCFDDFPENSFQGKAFHPLTHTPPLPPTSQVTPGF